MLFAIVCLDRPGQVEARKAHRDAHVAHLKRFEDRMLTVGPLQAEDRSHSVGSLLVMDFEDRAAAQAFCDADPFNAAGIFESVMIRPYKQILPEGD